MAYRGTRQRSSPTDSASCAASQLVRSAPLRFKSLQYLRAVRAASLSSLYCPRHSASAVALGFQSAPSSANKTSCKAATSGAGEDSSGEKGMVSLPARIVGKQHI